MNQQTERNRQRGGGRRGGWLLLIVGMLLLGGIIASILLLRQPPAPVPVLPAEDRDGILKQCETGEVASLSVTLRNGNRWTLLQDDSGDITLAEDPSFQLDPDTAQRLIADAALIVYRDVVSYDPKEYADRLAEFGLTDPMAIVRAVYRDGTEICFRLGDLGTVEGDPFYYMVVDGDDRLLAMDITTAEELAVERALLHAVVQPVIHQARIDRIELTDADGGVRAWQLDALVTDADAADRWQLISPIRYPVDGEKMVNLRKNLSNLHLGAYVAPADEENLTRYGFDMPRLTISVHMAAAELQSSGTAVDDEPVFWPESTVTITIGGAKSDMVDYVRYRDDIYVTSHFLLNVFIDLDPRDTLTRYPVLVPLSNLESLTIDTLDGTHTYEVKRTEQVAPNNELARDENGDVLWDVTVTRDGKEIGRDSFEQMYNRLLMVTVSGTLPDGWQRTSQPHTSLRFRTRTGVEHEIRLMDFDAMHDAVEVDGCALFYLVKGGLNLEIE